MIKNYMGIYSIGLKLAGYDVDLDPTLYSFSLIDSIYSLYNRGSLEFNDPRGVFNEALMLTAGQSVEPSLGLKSTILTSKMVVEKGPQGEFLGSDNIGSVAKANLIHEWKYKQTKASRSYSDRISGIVRSSIASSYNFSSITINDTGNNSKWYQSLITPAKFLTDILLKNAWANNADNTPFFSFIDCGNGFHFQSIAGMMQGKPAFTYIYQPHTNISERYDVILKMQYLGERDFPTQMSFHQFDPETGAMEQETIKLSDLKSGSSYAPFATVLDTDVTYRNLFWKKDTREDENRKGQMVDAFRSAFFLDKLFVLVPFNPKLLSGTKILVEVPVSRNEPDKKSARYSGEYLSLMTEHVWSASSKMAFTKVLLGRRNTEITKDLAAKLQMYGGV